MITGPKRFPRLRVRDLTGRVLTTPDSFEGRNNLVFVAFRRQQQEIIDSWIPWLESNATLHDLLFYEIPVLARRWVLLRPMIDGGMAAAIRDLQARRRTLTVYGNVNEMTRSLGITDRSTVSIFLVDRGGEILGRAAGPFDQMTAAHLLERARR